MKPFLLATVFAALLGASANAQSASATEEPTPKPEKGYWVVESNVHSPGHSIVYFYNRHQELIYQETIERKLNPERRRVVQRLNQALDAAVVAWERKEAPLNTLLAAQFRQ